MLIHLLIISSLIINIVRGQIDSPCPDVLTYEPRNQQNSDRWYGVITLTTPEDLEGLWLKIILDRKADLLGNWFAEAVSKDNIEYSIRNPSYTLEAGPPVLVRFFVKYNSASTVPTVKKIYLNGKQICPTKVAGPTEPTLHISKPRPTSLSSATGLNTGGSRPISSSSTNKWGVAAVDPDENSNDQTNSGTGLNTGGSRPISSTTWGVAFVDPDENPIDQTNRAENSLSSSAVSKDDDQFFNGDFYMVSSEKPTSRPVTAVKQPIQCGTVAQRASPLISHGQNTTPGQWPWHAALYRLKGTELIYTCGGTLISDRFVVTAAHCVTKPRTNNPVDKQHFVVYLGKYNLISFGNEVQDREIDRIIVHPEYNYTVYYNDIAVLKLNSEVEFNNFVRPSCLWDDGTNEIENLVGRQGTVVGWGFDENKQLSRNLMQAKMPIVSTSTCLFSNRNFFSQFIFDKNFCAGFKNGTSVCNGDSGGGMVIPKSSTRGQNTVWQLRGIVSVGVALQGEGVCDPMQYIVFTDAGKYVQWIKQIIAQQTRDFK